MHTHVSLSPAGNWISWLFLVLAISTRMPFLTFKCGYALPKEPSDGKQ